MGTWLSWCGTAGNQVSLLSTGTTHEGSRSFVFHKPWWNWCEPSLLYPNTETSECLQKTVMPVCCMGPSWIQHHNSARYISYSIKMTREKCWGPEALRRYFLHRTYCTITKIILHRMGGTLYFSLIRYMFMLDCVRNNKRFLRRNHTGGHHLQLSIAPVNQVKCIFSFQLLICYKTVTIISISWNENLEKKTIVDHWRWVERNARWSEVQVQSFCYSLEPLLFPLADTILFVPRRSLSALHSHRKWQICARPPPKTRRCSSALDP